MKKINIKEFREKGYLQELNRQFLHPLGLALAIKIDDDGDESLSEILDYRDDPEGIYFDIKNSDEERIQKFHDNERFIINELYEKIGVRIERLGFGVEPIPELEWEDADTTNIDTICHYLDIEFVELSCDGKPICQNINKRKLPEDLIEYSEIISEKENLIKIIRVKKSLLRNFYDL